MTARDHGGELLPTSHVFLTLAHGRSSRTFAARAGLVYGLAGVVPLLALWLVAATVYIGFHDKLVTALLTRERDMQYDYEDRIAALRTRIDRDASRRLLDQHAVESKLEELQQREADLHRRALAISRFDDKAVNLAIPGQKVSPAGPDGAGGSIDGRRAELSGAGMLAAAEPLDGASSSLSGNQLTARLSTLSATLDQVGTVQDSQMVGMANRARTLAGRLRTVFDDLGLSPQRFAGGDAPRGGPFVPLPESASTFDRATVTAEAAFDEVGTLQSYIQHVPLKRPLDGNPEVTSPFGYRTDPFLGRPALHTGLDLREDIGTEVRATAPGRVTFAGTASGYGTMVEIDHGSGLSTRYAHLSATEVSVGQSVATGATIGRVGATGRATGPHLHYETRIDGEPVDPVRFLAVGRAVYGTGAHS